MPKGQNEWYKTLILTSPLIGEIIAKRNGNHILQTLCHIKDIMISCLKNYYYHSYIGNYLMFLIEMIA